MRKIFPVRSQYSILTLYFSISTLQNANHWEHEINASIKKTRRKENNQNNYILARY